MIKIMYDVPDKDFYKTRYYVTIRRWVMSTRIVDEIENTLKDYPDLYKEKFFIGYIGDGKWVLFSKKASSNYLFSAFARRDWPHDEWLRFTNRIYRMNKIYDEKMKES